MTLYAKAPMGAIATHSITPGKKYEVLCDYGSAFIFTTDAGYSGMGLWQGCSYLHGLDWQRIEEGGVSHKFSQQALNTPWFYVPRDDVVLDNNGEQVAQFECRGSALAVVRAINKLTGAEV